MMMAFHQAMSRRRSTDVRDTGFKPDLRTVVGTAAAASRRGRSSMTAACNQRATASTVAIVDGTSPARRVRA